MATATLPREPLARWSPLTTLQSFWLSLQAALLLGVTSWQCCTNYEMVRLLWSDPTGARMGVAAMVLLLVNFLALPGGYWLLNRSSSTLGQGRTVLRTTLTTLLSVACFIGLYLPVVFVVLIGPSAVSIQNNLLSR